MELTYRGVRYTTTAPTIAAMNSPEQATFLGASFNRKRYQVAASTVAQVPLRFLGHTYIG